MEQVGRRGNVLFVNDSKGTNADAAAHALSSFADIFWIAGGKPKTGGITGLTGIFPAHPQGLSDRRGRAGICRHARGARAARDVARRWRSRSRSAARDAEASGLPMPVVLLSPACASFDQYRNFEIRGARSATSSTRCPA